MEQRLFEDLIDSDVATHRTNQAKVMPIAVVLHALAAAAIIIVPILQSGILPESSISVFFAEPMSAPAPPPPPPPPAPRARARPSAPTPVLQQSAFVAPVDIPQEIMQEEDLDLGFDEGVAGGVEGGVPGGVIGGVVGGLPDAPPPPAQAAIRIGGQIKPPKKLKNVDPTYPDIAKQARVQGVVILECTISPQGKVTNVKLLRGIPLLNESATTAVRQWVYTPTLLNGVPVPVIMTVTVNFKLS
jgi:protein TonB